MNNNNYDYSAADSVIGHLFQWKYALLESIEKLNEDIKFTTSIEKLDDIGFDEKGNLTLLQAKYHKNAVNITDSSEELWKTLRGWCKYISANNLDLNTTFYLVTTSTAPDKTAAFYLKPGNARDVVKALDILEERAKNSKNKNNYKYYDAFKELSKDEKEYLSDRIYVLDGSLSLDDIEEKVRSKVRLLVDREFLDSFIEYLEGWWIRRITRHLRRQDNGVILSEEIFAEIRDLNEQFKRENLPISKDILNFRADDSHYQKYKDHIFVHQLKIIGIDDERILYAISDYYRAFTQRSRWMKDNLVHISDLEDYENRLYEAWHRRYLAMKDELGEEAAEEEQLKAAKKLYKWVEFGDLPLIRPNCKEDFISRGSYQDLADSKKIGWHPNFIEKLKKIIEGETLDEVMEKSS